MLIDFGGKPDTFKEKKTPQNYSQCLDLWFDNYNSIQTVKKSNEKIHKIGRNTQSRSTILRQSKFTTLKEENGYCRIDCNEFKSFTVFDGSGGPRAGDLAYDGWKPSADGANHRSSDAKTRKDSEQTGTTNIRGCDCQELTPEQKEHNEKPPPCQCALKKFEKLNKAKKRDNKITPCPECDKIKLNANLLRAIQRINELQAQRKLTESKVKLILEEEYQGDIFGYVDKMKESGGETRVAEDTKEQTIAERELEMRQDFKEVIEAEVAKFEGRNQKKASPANIISSKPIQNAEEGQPPQTKEKPRRKKRKGGGLKTAQGQNMEEILKWMYPGHQFGHRGCLPKVRLVPKTMGWLWNTSKGAGLIKPGRGWVPGAIRKTAHTVMEEHKKERRSALEEEEERTVQARSSMRSGTPKSRENIKVIDKYNPTFHMHKKDGYYYFSLYPVKTEELDKMGQDPKPTMFKISAKHPDDGSDEWSTDDDSYELEFVTPSALKKQQRKKPPRKEASQQYLEEDFNKGKIFSHCDGDGHGDGDGNGDANKMAWKTSLRLGAHYGDISVRDGSKRRSVAGDSLSMGSYRTAAHYRNIADKEEKPPPKEEVKKVGKEGKKKGNKGKKGKKK